MNNSVTQFIEWNINWMIISHVHIVINIDFEKDVIYIMNNDNHIVQTFLQMQFLKKISIAP